jgi:mono/diheme cytochrome c family protein
MDKLLKSASVLLVFALVGSLLALGYRRSVPDRTDPYAEGKRVFAASCAQCHTIGGGSVAVAGRGDETLRGPDLGRVGADPGHTRQWFLDMIRDPQAENRLARMPKFAGKLSEGDLLALSYYLASLKGS